MAEEKTSQILIRLTAAQVKALDEHRRGLEDLPSRPEAIRRIVAEKLEGSK